MTPSAYHETEGYLLIKEGLKVARIRYAPLTFEQRLSEIIINLQTKDY